MKGRFTLLMINLYLIPIFGNNIVIHDINEKYGLPKNRVNCMAQDSKGFLWFGMVNGLYKFDLNSFTRYNLKDNSFNGFPELDVKTIVELAPGRLLVGANKGLYTFNTEKEIYDTLKCKSPIPFSDLHIQSICSYGNDNFWIGTDRGLVNIAIKNHENLEFELINFFDRSNSNLHSNEVIEIIKSPGGTIWFLTTADLGYFNVTAQSVTTYTSYRANASIVFDSNRIIQSCFGDGIIVFNTRSYSYENIELANQITQTKIRYTHKDSRGKFWLSISNVGLILMDSITQNKDLQLITNKSEFYTALNSNVIYKIFESNDGAIWLCTEEGINMLTLKPEVFKTQSFQSYTNQELSMGVRSLLNSKDKSLWIGTVGDGLIRQDLDTKSYVKVPLKTSRAEVGNIVQAIIEDIHGNIWIGTEGDGVIKLSNTDKFKNIPELINYRVYPQAFPRNTLLNDFVMCLLEDKNNNIWIGTWYGLSLLKYEEILKPDQSNAILKNFLHNPNDETSISHNTIMSLIKDKNGTIWAGTHAGINKIIPTKEGYQFESNFRSTWGEPVTNIKILDLFEDRNGDIWFSKQDGGIGLLDVQTGIFQEYNSSNGFHDYIVNSISQDSLGVLWLGTNNGLCRFDPATKTYKMYYSEDGLLSNDFFYRSGCEANNLLYFGGNKGITFFNPYEIVPEKVTPNLVFTNFNLFNEPVPLNHKKSPLKKHISFEDEIILKYNQNYITLEFAALNYKNQQEIQYTCILEGLETSWNKLHKDRKITYTNLSPGEYKFRVKSYSTSLYNNSKEISLTIIVKPPFWKTSWAYIVYLLLLVFIIFKTYKYFLNEEKKKHSLAIERLNAKRIHEMDLMKLQFYTKISHELRTPLTLISAPLETLMNESVEQSKMQSYFQLMFKNVQRLKRHIDQLLDLRKIEEGYLKMEWAQGDIIDFLKKIYSTFENYAEKRNIYFTFQSSCSQLNTYFDAEKLDKVLFNLLSNAFKYTPDYETIALKVEEKDHSGLLPQKTTEKFLEIKVSDSGIGIPKESITNIFKPFQQIKDNKPIGSTGSGIGLSLTKELIDLHKGFITVESEVNKGSVFTVHLPIYKNIPQNDLEINLNLLTSNELEVKENINTVELSNNTEIEDTASKPLVLIVEDNAELRTFLSGELQKNYRILESANGQDGLKIAIDKIPDLIVSDVMMDIMDGIELCTKLKTDQRTSHIPVILLTARHSEEIKLTSFEIGADDYITKPFNISLLLSRIKNLIEQRRRLRKLFGTGNNIDFSAIANNKTDTQFLEKLNQAIERNIDDPDFSPVSLASDMAMSKMQLYRKVSALTNQTVYNYIRTIRLNKAATLLLTTEMQIAEIALNVGYTEPSNFTKCFNRQFNQTPSQFVRANKK